MSLVDDPYLRDAPVEQGHKVLAPCVLLAKVGEGGMGAVYRARHLNFDQEVAVKVLHPDLARADGTFVQRFRKEASMAAAVVHEHLIQVFEVNHRHGVHYIVMEFVRGENVRQRVRRKGPLSIGEASAIVRDAARGLAKAHAKGIVHRDVKPDNILVSIDGEVKVADLGLAKATESDDGLTATRVMMGTPQYTPPEQWNDAREAGPRADVWALGATLWHALAGRPAIESGPALKVGYQIVNEPYPDIALARSDVPDELQDILERCLQQDPAARYADADGIATDLDAFLTTSGSSPSLADPKAASKPEMRTEISPPPNIVSSPQLERTISDHGHGGAPAAAASKVSTSSVPPAPKSRTRLWAAIGIGVGLIGFGIWVALKSSSGYQSSSEAWFEERSSIDSELALLAPPNAVGLVHAESIASLNEILVAVDKIVIDEDVPRARDLLKKSTKDSLRTESPIVMTLDLNEGYRGQLQVGDTYIAQIDEEADPAARPSSRFRIKRGQWSVWSMNKAYVPSSKPHALTTEMLKGRVSGRFDLKRLIDTERKDIDRDLTRSLRRTKRAGNNSPGRFLARAGIQITRDIVDSLGEADAALDLSENCEVLTGRAELRLREGSPLASNPLFGQASLHELAGALEPSHPLMMTWCLDIRERLWNPLLRTMQSAVGTIDPSMAGGPDSFLRSLASCSDSFGQAWALSAGWGDHLELVIVGTKGEGTPPESLLNFWLGGPARTLGIRSTEAQIDGALTHWRLSFDPDHPSQQGNDPEETSKVLVQMFGVPHIPLSFATVGNRFALILGSKSLAQATARRLGDTNSIDSSPFAQTLRDAGTPLAFAARLSLRDSARALAKPMKYWSGEDLEAPILEGPPAEISTWIRQDKDRVRLSIRCRPTEISDILKLLSK